MHAPTFPSMARAPAAIGQPRSDAAQRLGRRIFGRMRRAAAIALTAAAAASAIVGLRLLLWAIGHPDQPWFRAIAGLWR